MKINYFKIFKEIAFIVLSLVWVFTGCKSENSKSASVTDTIWRLNIKNSNEVKNETINDGKRLTRATLESYLPESIGTLKKNNEPQLKTSKKDRKTGGIHHKLSQTYRENSNAITIEITDYADDQAHINQIMENKVRETFTEGTGFSNKTYKNNEGWYITENELYRGEVDDRITTSSDLSIVTPRFSVFLKAVPTTGQSAPDTGYLLNVFNKTQLPKLFDLPVPMGEVKHKEGNSGRLLVNCDEILPENIVKKRCKISAVEVKTTSFEGENNCNRYYRYPGSSSNLTFLLTQYTNEDTGKKAVTVKINDKNLNAQVINNLGQAAVLVEVGEDLYMSIAHKNYLIELRSFKKVWNKDEKCCVCHSKEELITIAKDVITRL